jgi:membrane protein required for colicin V production
MNWIDFFILFVLFLALINGYRRGIFKEISTFLGLIVGVIFAVSNADWLAMQLEGKLNISPSILYVASFILVLAASLILLRILGRYFYKMVKITPLKVSDKVGGSVFGVIKGLVLLSLLFLLFIFPTPFRAFDGAIESSALAKPIRGLVPLVYNNTTYLHPGSGEFLAELQKGILLSSASLYAGDPGAALRDKALLGMSDDDVKTLDKLNQYFSKTEKELK